MILQYRRVPMHHLSDIVANVLFAECLTTIICHNVIHILFILYHVSIILYKTCFCFYGIGKLSHISLFKVYNNVGLREKVLLLTLQLLTPSRPEAILHICTISSIVFQKDQNSILQSGAVYLFGRRQTKY